ncbi:hypothetical protein ACWOQQ_26020, partial [Enterobacter sp. ESY66]
ADDAYHCQSYFLSGFADAGRLPWREPGLSCFAPSQLRCLCPAPPGQRVSIPGCRNVNTGLAAAVPAAPPLARRGLRFRHPGGEAAGL